MKVYWLSPLFVLAFTIGPRDALGQTAQSPAKQAADRAYTETENASIARVQQMYPDMGVAGTPLNDAVNAKAKDYREKDPKFFENPNWPILLVTQVAGALGIVPKDPSSGQTGLNPRTAAPTNNTGVRSVPQTPQTQRDYSAAETESIKRAVGIYPDAGVKGSKLSNALQAAVLERQTSNPQFFQNTEWPLLLTTELARSMGIVAHGTNTAAVQAPPLVEFDVPSLTVRSAGIGRKDVPSITSERWNQSQTVRSIGANIEFHFFHPRKTPFEIQAFFIAKDEGSKKQYVYDTVLYSGKETSGKMDLNAAPLLGSGSQWLDIPISGTTTGTAVDSNGNFSTVHGTYSGTLTFSKEIVGSHVEGWIVRFTSGGSVLTVNSNQQFLLEMAHKNAAFFSAAADTARKAKSSGTDLSP